MLVLYEAYITPCDCTSYAPVHVLGKASFFLHARVSSFRTAA
jgi:hypothetical protein